jgi:hypothetical protein
MNKRIITYLFFEEDEFADQLAKLEECFHKTKLHTLAETSIFPRVKPRLHYAQFLVRHG